MRGKRGSRTTRALAAAVASLAVTGVAAGTAQAGVPDGAAGPWADQMTSANQGQRADGSAVLPTRSVPAAALGPSENTNSEGTFYSLGFGGQTVLHFDNNVCNGSGADLDLQLVEATREPYPDEKVKVEASLDGTHWFDVATVTKDAQVAFPGTITVAHYVRLTDLSSKQTFLDAGLNDADGYDVDGVKALNTNCRDNNPPDCSKVTASDPLLWPPNHRYVLETLGGATDPNGDPVTLTITGVTQDEALNGLGDGDTSPDAKAGSKSNQVYVRSERSGTGDGRVYRIAFTGSDGKGGICEGTATVGVPHDQGQGSTPIDSGLIVNSFGP